MSKRRRYDWDTFKAELALQGIEPWPNKAAHLLNVSAVFFYELGDLPRLIGIMSPVPLVCALIDTLGRYELEWNKGTGYYEVPSDLIARRFNLKR